MNNSSSSTTGPCRGQTRRQFVRRGLTFLAAGYAAPLFLARTGWSLDQQLGAAATRSIPGMPDDTILVVIQLGGGNDGLNTVVPHAMDDYYRARPQLAIAANDTLKLDDTIGFHPALKPLRALYDEGHLAVVQGVGYPNPNRSHFQSMEIWHTADPGNTPASYGWLGRYLDNACVGCDPNHNLPSPLGGISLGDELPLAMKSRQRRSVAIENPASLDWVPIAEADADPDQAADTFAQLNRVVGSNLDNPHVARLDFLSRVALDAGQSAARLRGVLQGQRGGVGGRFPGSRLGRELQTISRLIAGGLETRVYYATHGGFDTHANQDGRHRQLLTQFAEAVAAFYRDLEMRGDHRRVMIVSFSEFGRRVEENASRGTDHGAAAPLFVLGGGVKGGVYGCHPSLRADDLDRGDVKFHTDFRQVYATMLEDWLGMSAQPVLGAAFNKLPLA